MGAIKEKIESALLDAVSAIEFLQREESVAFIESCASRIESCFARGGKLLIAGNGGSLCDAMHFAEELSGLYREKRPAMAAIALSDPGHMSCVANDLGYDKVFSRAIEAFGKPEDIFIGLTTSGNSPNIVEAVRVAKEKNIETIAFLGKSGGTLKGMCDLEIIVSGFRYSDRVQEAHMTAIHIIIEMVESLMLPSLQEPQLTQSHVS
jgi:D-sedoheptulose 7-phosphate isomerase